MLYTCTLFYKKFLVPSSLTLYFLCDLGQFSTLLRNNNMSAAMQSPAVTQQNKCWYD